MCGSSGIFVYSAPNSHDNLPVPPSPSKVCGKYLWVLWIFLGSTEGNFFPKLNKEKVVWSQTRVQHIPDVRAEDSRRERWKELRSLKMPPSWWKRGPWHHPTFWLPVWAHEFPPAPATWGQASVTSRGKLPARSERACLLMVPRSRSSHQRGELPPASTEQPWAVARLSADDHFFFEQFSKQR